jgi:hypothetical protein
MPLVVIGDRYSRIATIQRQSAGASSGSQSAFNAEIGRNRAEALGVGPTDNEMPVDVEIAYYLFWRV